MSIEPHVPPEWADEFQHFTQTGESSPAFDQAVAQSPEMGAAVERVMARQILVARELRACFRALDG